MHLGELFARCFKSDLRPRRGWDEAKAKKKAKADKKTAAS